MFDRSVMYFMKVVEKGSFSAAARDLYLTQPALSKTVGQLERNLGFPLFDRTGYRPHLTPEGRIYYDEVKKLSQEYDQTLQRIRKDRKTVYRIGFTGTRENRTLPGRLKSLRESDHLDFAFVRCTFNEQQEKLLTGDIDLAFGLESTFAGISQIEYRPLVNYQMVVICPKDAPLSDRKEVTPSDLAGEKMVVLSPDFGRGFFRDFMEAYRLDHMKCDLIEKDTFDDLILAVTLGEGIAIVSRDVAPDHGVQVLPFAGHHFHNRYVLAWRSGNTDPAFLAALEKIAALYQTP